MSVPDASQKNRRRGQRRKPKHATQTQCFKGALGLGPNVALAALDVSEQGARLVLKEPLEPGQQAQIHLSGLGYRRPLKVLATVVWVVPAADGTYCVGLRFDKSLRYADLQLLA
jgi:hypothetical protein